MTEEERKHDERPDEPNGTPGRRHLARDQERFAPWPKEKRRRSDGCCKDYPGNRCSRPAQRPEHEQRCDSSAPRREQVESLPRISAKQRRNENGEHAVLRLRVPQEPAAPPRLLHRTDVRLPVVKLENRVGAKAHSEE